MNLEKLARIKGMLVEDFVAQLYGRTRGLTSKDILDRVEVMPSRDFAQVLRVMAERMDTAKDAPPIVRREKGGEEDEERVPLELPERVVATDGEGDEANGEMRGEV